MRQEYTMGQGQSLQYMVLGRLDSPMQENETGPLSCTMYRNSKWIKDVNVRPENKTLRRK